MKKIIIFILAVCFLTTTGYATSGKIFMTVEEQKSIDRLKELEIISENCELGNATRLDCLTMLIKIYNFHELSEMDIDLSKEYTAKYSDADTLDSNTDIRTVAKADMIGILVGAEEGKRRYIKPDSEITWREMLLFSLRFCEPQYSYLYDNDEGIMERAGNRWLCGEGVGVNMLDKTVTKAELCVIMNRILHTPIEVHAYGGIYTKYYIDNYIK